jgi:hypothetical protein
MAKGDLRAAGERLEKGIEKYGNGDLVAAAVEFEEALRLSPEHGRARQYLSWVKDVLAGTRGNGKKQDLDEDAVRAVTEALETGEDSSDDLPWNPVPLTPAPTERQPSSPMNTIPYGLEEAIAARSETRSPSGTAATELSMAVPSLITPPKEPTAPKEPPARAASTLTQAPRLPQPDAPAPETRPETRADPKPPEPRIPSDLRMVDPRSAESRAHEDRVPTAPGTILGIAPPREGILRPVTLEERPESVTREFSRGTPTLHNLPPLDVPELTEEQVAELISVESTLPTTGPTGRPLGPDLAMTPDLPTEQRPSFIEFEAESTPLPQPYRSPTTRDRRPGEEPQSKLQPLPFAPDFDPLEMTPTHALRDAVEGGRLNPLPVDERPDLPVEHEEEVTQNPTNPFIRKKLADYAYPSSDEEELSGVPTGKRTVPKPSIADIMAQAKRVLANGDPQTAVDIADDVVTASGGVDADSCLPYLSLLEKIYEGVIGSFSLVPNHGGNVPDLDPRAAFLLSRIDGSLTTDDLLEVSGMPRLEAMRVLALLIRHGAVVTR